VTGIIRDLPSNTRFDFDYLLPWSYFERPVMGTSSEADAWLSNNSYTFVQLNPNTDLVTFNRKIRDVSRHHTGRSDVWTHFAFPLSKWHLYSSFENGVPVGGRIETVRIFALIACMILLVACINFVNLSTARSERRTKEVGIRKVAGAGRSVLIGQFVTEAMLMSAMSGFLAMILVQLVLPYFNTLVGVQLLILWMDFRFWLFLMGFIVLSGALAGVYPAFYLSSFNPIGIFRGQFKRARSGFSPRKTLVVAQFTIAVILIISTLVIRNQVIFSQERDKGYSNNNLVQVNFVGDIDKNYMLIRQELLQSGLASSVTKTMSGMIPGGAHTWGLRWTGEAAKDTTTTITLFSADAGFVQTAGLHLVDGRDIDIYNYPQDSFSVLLNETAVKLMGFEHPVGQKISGPYPGTKLNVVGVVKDYVVGSPYETIPPVVIQGPGAWFTAMHIKFNSGQAMAANLARAEQIFREFNPAYPFDYKFVDEEYARQFNEEQRTKSMTGWFAFLVVFISGLGLFGLSAFVAENRIKEVGIRKVLGATVFGISRLLALDFIKLVLLAILLAIPVSYFVMDKWLQGYAYRIDIGWGTFLVAGLLAILIALVTVSFQSIRAALSNPVISLRKE
jgi:ABC-type antimicrobial peptide transport system permease subunit